MVVTNLVKDDNIKVGAFKKLTRGFYSMFKDLEEEMKKDSNFMMEVNKATNINIGK